MSKTLPLVLLLSFMIVFNGGCIFDPDKDGGDAEDLLASPEGIAEQIERAYIRKDIDLYLNAMVDTAVFHFRPSDIDVAWPAPTWGKTEEEFFHRNMFRQAHHVEIALVGDVAEMVSEFPEKWRLYREYDVLVYLTEETLSEKSPAYGWAEFEIVKCDDDRYRIVDWYDLENPP